MGIKTNIKTLDNASATGSTQSVPNGGRYVYMISGTFGATSSKLQILGPDGVTFIDVPSTTFTVAGYVAVDIPSGASVRTVLTGGTPSAMHANLNLVGRA
jgi:hypothetical protein